MPAQGDAQAERPLCAVPPPSCYVPQASRAWLRKWLSGTLSNTGRIKGQESRRNQEPRKIKNLGTAAKDKTEGAKAERGGARLP